MVGKCWARLRKVHLSGAFLGALIFSGACFEEFQYGSLIKSQALTNPPCKSTRLCCALSLHTVEWKLRLFISQNWSAEIERRFGNTGIGLSHWKPRERREPWDGTIISVKCCEFQYVEKPCKPRDEIFIPPLVIPPFCVSPTVTHDVHETSSAKPSANPRKGWLSSLAAWTYRLRCW